MNSIKVQGVYTVRNGERKLDSVVISYAAAEVLNVKVPAAELPRLMEELFTFLHNG